MECLCSRYSSTGFTLGEIGLGCVYSECLDVDERAANVYRICDGVFSAVVPTHEKLTVLSEGPGAKESEEVDINDASTDGELPTPPSQQPSSTESGAVQSETLVASPTQSKDSSSAQPAKSTSTGSVLSTAQIIGISVAGGSTLVLAIGAVLIGACLRRYRARKKAKARDDQEDDGLERFAPSPSRSISPSKMKLKDPRGGMGGVGVAPLPTNQGQISKSDISYPDRALHKQPTEHQSGLGGNWVDQNVSPDQIGVAVSPEIDRPNSQNSFRSTRTMSRLLPEKPSPVLKPAPLRIHHASVMSQMTEFEEDDRATVMMSPTIGAFHLPARARNDFPRAMHQTKASVERAHQPALSLEIPRRPVRTSSLAKPQVKVMQPNKSRPDQPPVERVLPMPFKFPPPPNYRPQVQGYPAPLSIPRAHESFATPPLTGASSDYIPNYYTKTPKTIGMERFDKPHGTPKLVKINSVSSRSTSVQSMSRNTSLTKSRRDSNTSCTTFESADPDEPTPPEEDEKQLSPVAESPISGLRYPKIPRTSNQAIPRSPKRPAQVPAHPRTLLEKRRGDNTAHDIEKRLWVTDSNRGSENSGNYSHMRAGSDATIRMRVDPVRSRADDDIRHHSIILPQVPQFNSKSDIPISPGMEIIMKSPLWAPRLTPTRRGDDLYLAVS